MVCWKREIRSESACSHGLLDILENRHSKIGSKLTPFRYISSVIVTIGPSYFGLGGSMISPPRSVQDKTEVTFKEVKWVPFGEDVVMASRISPSSFVVSPIEKDFG
jgi:hypothetical protein